LGFFSESKRRGSFGPKPCVTAGVATGVATGVGTGVGAGVGAGIGGGGASSAAASGPGAIALLSQAQFMSIGAKAGGTGNAPERCSQTRPILVLRLHTRNNGYHQKKSFLPNLGSRGVAFIQTLFPTLPAQKSRLCATSRSLVNVFLMDPISVLDTILVSISLIACSIRSTRTLSDGLAWSNFQGVISLNPTTGGGGARRQATVECMRPEEELGGLILTCLIALFATGKQT